VRANQRERLLAAMVATSTEKGYEATRVADLVTLSGVSRKAFYEHFADKEDCFLATLDEILTAAVAITASRLENGGSWEERARRGLASFVELVVDQPAAARLCMVEAYAAGPRAIARMDEAIAGFGALMRRAFEEMPERQGMPEEMIGAMVGGFRKIIHTRLQRGDERELTALVPDLLEVGLSYRPPPQPLGGPRRGAVMAPNGDHDSADPAERLVRATMAVVAEKGYAAATIADVAEAARVSLSTFYAHFDGKERAFEAALYSGRARMLGFGLPAYKRARNWPEGMRAVTEATFAYLEAEPEFARLICVDVHAAGAGALARRDRAIDAAQRFIDDGVAEHAPAMKPILREAIIGFLYAMLCERVCGHGVRDLRGLAPLATYMALSPFLGGEAACSIASGGPASSDSPRSAGAAPPS
jgi:AcrR family transcriptional regulator